MGSSKVQSWGANTTDMFAQPPQKQKRKPPIPAKQAVPQQKVEVKSVESPEMTMKEQPRMESGPLLARIAQLEERLARLESDSQLSAQAICTLNSSGATKGSKISWSGSTNHILGPGDGFELSEDSCSLHLKHTGYYEIMVNCYGSNPELVINEDVFASSHTIKGVSGHFGINLYLEQGAFIEVHARGKCVEGNACDHWLSVRRLSIPIQYYPM